jgi:hypothetical protein
MGTVSAGKEKSHSKACGLGFFALLLSQGDFSSNTG